MNMKRFTALLITVMLLIALPGVCEDKTNELEVHFLSVGTNDGILLIQGDECAFIDSGNYPEGVLCAEYMKNHGVESLKYYIGTHAHLDHIGGAPAIVSAIPTESIIYTYEHCLDAMYVMAQNEQEIKALDDTVKLSCEYLDTFMLGDALITCVGPVTYVPKHSLNDTTENNNSVLLHITFGETSFFLTGDSPSWKVLAMAEDHPEVLHSTVIKAPHHRGGFDKSVYKMIDSEYVVFSTASSWLPREDQMRMAFEAADRVLITADNRNGDIRFVTDGTTLRVETQFDYLYEEY